MPPGPSVPESCPPCPASTTMRPIFRPSARVRERRPSNVELASCEGLRYPPASSSSSSAVALLGWRFVALLFAVACGEEEGEGPEGALALAVAVFSDESGLTLAAIGWVVGRLVAFT